MCLGLQADRKHPCISRKRPITTRASYYLRASVLGGRVVAEINASGGWARGYVYLGSQLLALQQGGVEWVHQDPVTKNQRLTDINGQVTAVVELAPWGGESGGWSVNSWRQPQRYTSYIRDANQSDEAMQRRYNRWWQRFDQPDPYDGSYDLSEPQSFNRYAYAQNDPVNFTDPSGLDPTAPHWTDFCFSAAYSGCGSGPQMAAFASNFSMLLTFGPAYWDLPGYANEAAQGEFLYEARRQGIPTQARYIGNLSWAYTDYSSEGTPSYTWTISQDRLSRLIFWNGQFAFDRSGVIWDVHGRIIGERGLEADFGTQMMLAAPFSGLLRRSTGSVTAELGNKLNYLFGRATGSPHNITRSTEMLRQMQRIGIFDTAANRAYLQTYFNHVLRNSNNILHRQANGRIIRESLLMGPNGGVKVVSVWEGRKLITFNLFGGG